MAGLAVWMCTLPSTAQHGAKGGEWRFYGGDAGTTKYSDLDQIQRGNVAQLNLIQRGVRDYVDTFTFGETDEEIYRILAQYTDLKSVDHWKQVNVPGLNPNGYFVKSDVRKQIQWFKDNGYYKGQLEVDEVTDYGPVDFALQVLGRYRYPIDFE